MPVSSERSLSRDRAWSCIMMNIATPGTGTLRARRCFSGFCQLGFLFAGFFLICTWMLKWIYRIYLTQSGESLPSPPAGWLWKWGAVGFGVSWIWTFFTCLSLWSRAKANERNHQQNVPPRLADLPEKPKPPKL
jgi:hypothetical protein